MITEAKIKRILRVCNNYATDGCYEASQRQYQLACQALIDSFASEKRMDLEKALAYQQMALLLMGK
jgi:hypothetical protein